MKALVVYESMFGNTEQIARAVAAGLEESVDVAGGRGDGCADRTGSRRCADRGGRSHPRFLDEPDEHSRRRNQQRRARRANASLGCVSGWRRCHLGNTPRRWPHSTPRSKACTTYPGQPPKAPLKPPAAMGMSPRRKPRVFTSRTSTVRFSTVRLIGRGLGVDNLPPQSLKLPPERRVATTRSKPPPSVRANAVLGSQSIVIHGSSPTTQASWPAEPHRTGQPRSAARHPHASGSVRCPAQLSEQEQTADEPQSTRAG